MEKKEFYQERKELHKNIVAEIVALMVEHNVNEVDLLGSSADYAFIMVTPDFDWDYDYMEVDVSKVYYEDGQILLDIILDVDTDELAEQNEDGDIGDAYQVINANDFTKVMACVGIDSVYESVWQVLEEGK